jgi:uncharacterized membrane protein YwaF
MLYIKRDNILAVWIYFVFGIGRKFMEINFPDILIGRSVLAAYRTLAPVKHKKR